MPFLLDWTSPFPIKKRFLHLRESLIRYCSILHYSFTNSVLRLLLHHQVFDVSNPQCHSVTILFLFQPLPSRFPTLAVNHLPYFLMILTTTCALLTKKCSAHLHTLRFPLPTKFTSTWGSQKPSSSVPRVLKFYI